jgi:hypothetical protein
MRKNITIYNHKKFADAPGTAAQSQAKPAVNPAVKPVGKPATKTTTNPEVKLDPAKMNIDFINKIIKSPNKDAVVSQLVYLFSRYVLGDKKLEELKKEPSTYDKEVFSIPNSNQYILMLANLKSNPKIDKQALNGIANNFTKYILQKISSGYDPQSEANTSTTPTNQQVPQAPNVLSPAQAAEQPQITPEQADKYLSNIIPVLETLSKDKEKPRAFTQRYSNEYNYIINSMSVLRNDPKFFQKLESFNTTFKKLAPIYNNAMHPTGWTAAGNSVFVTDWYTLGDQIIKDIQGKKIEDATTKLTTFQTEFLNKNPKNTDISGVANKVNQFVDQYNTAGFGATQQYSTLTRLK